MWCFWIFPLLFVILGIIFFCGKGSFLIAGYNTMKPEEKARWDEKALCKALGVLMFLCAAFFAVIELGVTIDNYILLTLGIILFLIVIFAGVVYVNTSNKFKRK